MITRLRQGQIAVMALLRFCMLSLTLGGCLMGLGSCQKDTPRPTEQEALPSVVHDDSIKGERIELNLTLEEIPSELSSPEARMILSDAGRSKGVDYLFAPGEVYPMQLLFVHTSTSGQRRVRVGINGGLIIGSRIDAHSYSAKIRVLSPFVPRDLETGKLQITGAIGVSSLNDKGEAVIPQAWNSLQKGAYTIPMYFPLTELHRQAPTPPVKTASWVGERTSLRTYGSFVAVEIDNQHDTSYIPSQLRFETSAFHTSGTMNLLQMGADNLPAWTPEDLNSPNFQLIGTSYYSNGSNIALLKKQQELWVRYSQYDAKTNQLKRTLKTITYNNDAKNTQKSSQEETTASLVPYEHIVDLRQGSVPAHSSRAFFAWVKPNPKARRVGLGVKVYSQPLRAKDISLADALMPDMAESFTTPTFRERAVHRLRLSAPAPAMSAYSPLLAEKISEGIKVPISKGWTPNQQGGQDISKAIDGNMNTPWHSRWDNSDTKYFPIPIRLEYNKEEEIDYLVYYPSAGANGRWGEVSIEYEISDGKWKAIKRVDFLKRDKATRVDFGQRVRTKKLRLTIYNGSGDGQGFAAAAEIETYRHDGEFFDPLTIFKDKTCSDLRADITDLDISAIQDPFFRNLATKMKQGLYEREFRIAEYTPRTYPDADAASSKRRPYSMLDNPTGIYVEQGETLVVLVGDTGGWEVPMLRVVDLYKPGGDGFDNYSTYTLAEGVNKLKMERRGLVYLLHHKHNANSPQQSPIKIHFASGKVNGYFDAQNPAHEGRFAELLSKAVGDYFDVLGKYAHLTLPTESFRTYTQGRGKELIEVYDKIVEGEYLLHGYTKYNRIPSNRLYLHVAYFPRRLFGTGYHAGLPMTAMEQHADPIKMSYGGLWGTAHEIGHINQTNGLKWIGMTEVTVNIPALYIQTYIFNRPSRWETTGRYSEAWQAVYTKPTPQAFALNISKETPFWQLELFFGKAKGNTPTLRADKGGFYPDVYEYYRKTATGGWSHGKQQIEFVYTASKISGYDLTDFLGRWGFLTPIDQEVEDYGKARLTITQAMVDEMRQRIASLNLPKPRGAIEYITDSTAELYKTYPKVQAGQAGRSGDRITLNGWRNVVAYEVYDAAGRLILVSPGAVALSQPITLELPQAWANGFSAKAVSADGERIAISL